MGIMASAGRSSIPLVSVILPTYNRAPSLARAIESVLNQSYGEIEVLVVDDGSVDGTMGLIRGFDDPRLRYFRLERNAGAAHARNVGLRSARGEYIAFQDSDDEWMPDKLHRQLRALEDHPEAAVAYTDMIWVSDDGRREYMSAPEVDMGRLVGRDGREYQVFRLGIQTVLARAYCIHEIGFFDETLPRFIDLDFMIRLSIKYPFVYLREPLVVYHSSQGISANVYNEYLARRMLLAKYEERMRGEKSFLGHQYFCMGRALMRSGRFAEGRRWLLRSAAAQPLSPAYLCHASASLLGEKIYAALIARWGEKSRAGERIP
ncbi:MAG: glycosyltransferase [Actinobacteria bacterium]|nr:glycosyltransferase [Actinomycetota bacterium]